MVVVCWRVVPAAQPKPRLGLREVLVSQDRAVRVQVGVPRPRRGGAGPAAERRQAAPGPGAVRVGVAVVPVVVVVASASAAASAAAARVAPRSPPRVPAWAARPGCHPGPQGPRPP